MFESDHDIDSVMCDFLGEMEKLGSYEDSFRGSTWDKRFR